MPDATPTTAAPEGEVRGPYTGDRIDTLEDLDELRRWRGELLRAKNEHRSDRARWEQLRGPVWRVANVRRVYKAEVGRVEVREETALVDQYVFLTRHEHVTDGLVEEKFDVSTQLNKDDRVWSYVIRGERRFARHFIAPQERFVTRLVARQRAVLDRSARRRRALRRASPLRAAVYSTLVFVPLLLLRIGIKLEEILFFSVVRGQRALADKSVDLPVLVREGVQVTTEEMATTHGRRFLRLALFNEIYLTPQRRKALLFVGMVLLLVGWILAEILIRVLAPEAMEAKRQTDLVFFYSIATRLLLPSPYEIVLAGAAQVLGIVVTVLVAAAGAVIGSWLLFLVGRGANKGLKKVSRPTGVTVRLLTWLEKRARTFGYIILFAWLSIPFSPDTFPILLFSVLNLRVRWFLITVFAATILRSSLFLVLWG